MTALEIFNSLQHSRVGEFISHQDHMLGATAQLMHVAGLVLVLSSVLLVSLRLIGHGPRALTAAQLATATHKLVWTGLGLLLVSGLLMFVPAALLYYPNTFFRVKFVLLALALIVYFTLYRRAARSGQSGTWLSWAAALISLGLWFGVAVMGRFIGFF
ncbi:MAG TPA: DUF6644 family protein [Candidatus Acidoferrum sp.]|nr:DUF6644 family protein [Candidatus Acidoferrum sp.]